MNKHKKLKLVELNRLDLEGFRETEKLPLTLVLNDIRSHANVGSMFRTADAFALERIVLGGITPKPPHREIHKTALGAELAVKWSYCSTLTDEIERLKEDGYEIWALEQTTNSISLERVFVQSNQKIVIILGNEVTGVSSELIELCDACIEIPQYGTKHSFNVSVAAGMALWEIQKGMRT